jgi:hypothetical protein
MDLIKRIEALEAQTLPDVSIHWGGMVVENRTTETAKKLVRLTMALNNAEPTERYSVTGELFKLFMSRSNAVGTEARKIFGNLYDVLESRDLKLQISSGNPYGLPDRIVLTLMGWNRSVQKPMVVLQILATTRRKLDPYLHIMTSLKPSLLEEG